MQHTHGRQEPVDQSSHPFPRQPVSLTASPQAPKPPFADVCTKGRQQAGIGGDREVGEIALDHGSKPPSLLIDRRVPLPMEFLFDLPEFRSHSLSLCLASALEARALLLGGAVVCEPQEVERFRLALTPLPSAFGGKAAKLDKAGLVRVQGQRKLCEAFLEIIQEALRVLLVLEADDRVE